MYSSVEDIDLYVGLTLEEPEAGARVGLTNMCIIGDQLARLKNGDRYFYDLSGQPGSFSRDQLDQIRKTSLARLICNNVKGVEKIQPLALKVSNLE